MIANRRDTILLFILLLLTVAASCAGLQRDAEAGGDCSAVTRPPDVPGWEIPDCLRITYAPATNTTHGHWKLTAALFEPDGSGPGTSGGQHNIYLRALDANGNHPEPVPWHVVNGGDSRGMTKHPPEWADFPMFASYAPFEGQCGGYSAFMGDDPARSDRVGCMALPYRQHVNFRLVWTYRGPAPDLPFDTFLPLVAESP